MARAAGRTEHRRHWRMVREACGRPLGRTWWNDLWPPCVRSVPQHWQAGLPSGVTKALGRPGLRLASEPSTGGGGKGDGASLSAPWAGGASGCPALAAGPSNDAAGVLASGCAACGGGEPPPRGGGAGTAAARKSPAGPSDAMWGLPRVGGVAQAGVRAREWAGWERVL